MVLAPLTYPELQTRPWMVPMCIMLNRPDQQAI